jgi:hypothetical protein
MRASYLRNGVLLLVLFVFLVYIWYFVDPTNVSEVIAFFVLVGSVYYFIMGLRSSSSISSNVMAPSQPSYGPPQGSQPTGYIGSTQPSTINYGVQCPSCGEPLSFLTDYKQWYCVNEKKFVRPILPKPPMTMRPTPPPGQNVTQQLADERAKLHKDLEMLEQRLLEGKISETTYQRLKKQYETRLGEIE